MQIKHSLPVHMSDEAYEMLRHLLSYHYLVEDNMYIPIALHTQLTTHRNQQAVNAPALPSLYCSKRNRQLEIRQYDPEQYEDRKP